MKSKYRVRQADVQPYSPANHTGTKNFRLIGAETVGAKQLEVLVGEIERGKGALPHAHPGIEQVCYLLEGEAHVEVAGEKFEMKPGEACFFPPDSMHVFLVTSERAKGSRGIRAALRRARGAPENLRWISPSRPIRNGFARRLQAVRAIRRRILAEEGQGRRLSVRAARRARAGRLARHRDARGVRRRGPRHLRGGDPDAGDRGIRRRLLGCIGRAHEYLRPQPGRGVRHRRAKETHAARLIAGKERACFAVTEPNTGLNTTRIKTKAEKQGSRYLISGQKVWISTAQIAEKVLLLARTTPIEECARPQEA
jgi:quercetin dioxygenase-like cupin family protein